MAWKIAATTSAVLMMLAAIAGISRVAWHEENEIVVVERGTIAELTARSRGENRIELARAHLVVDQRATFELCAADPMLPERWANAMSLTIRPRSSEEGLTFALTENILANVERNEAQGCLILGEGPILAEDDYAVEASWDDRPEPIANVLLQTRILAQRDVDDIDLGVIALGWLGAFMFAFTFALRRPAPVVPDARASSPDLDEWERAQAAAAPKIPVEVRVGAGIAVFVGAFMLMPFLPPGAALGLGSSLALGLAECGIALGFAPGPGLRRRLAVLALHAPRRPLVVLPISIVAGVLLYALALASLALVPSTGEAPIQRFVSWPSGLVSFAALAVVAPLAEEIFFRGFVYGGLEKRSPALAFVAAWLLFVALHAAQTWGQWGALVAILLTGLGLTTLRALSKSTMVPALAHLVYNGILAMGEVISRA